MQINGTVKNANTGEILSGAKVELYVDESEIAVLYTDDKGEFESSQSGDYIGEILVCKVEKDEFKDAEIKLDIEEEEVTLNIELIPVHVPIKMIKISGKVVDDKTNAPIDGADVTFKVGTEDIQKLKTAADGLFSFEINESYKGKKIEYEAKKDGSQLLTGKIEISKDMASLDLRLIMSFDIPVWLGLKSKRNLFLYGNIAFFLVPFLIAIKYDLYELRILMTIILLFPLVTSAIIKGYLNPVVSSLVAGLNLLNDSYGEDDFRWDQILMQYLLLVGLALIGTFFARRRAFKEGSVNDKAMFKDWLKRILDFIKRSVKRLLIIIGIGILIALLIKYFN